MSTKPCSNINSKQCYQSDQPKQARQEHETQRVQLQGGHEGKLSEEQRLKKLAEQISRDQQQQ